MSKNYKWRKGESCDTSGLHYVVLFSSRNKDNKDVEGFHERKRSYYRTDDREKIMRDFNDFVNHGVPGEMCRLYISLNARDDKKVRKALIHMLIDEDDFPLDYIESKLAGIAAKKENASEKHWFFDYDSELSVDRVADKIYEIDKTLNPYPLKTPNGYAIIVEHGFDTRELMKYCEENKIEVSLKRDDLICYHWKTKED